ncbi:hypothetical protein [Candidatus Electrothrix sp.]|uniref:hypothetical protein n=1 Tax=Candidatus Electrothrix sp. TaxID=2170559 RepID=UPI0040562312
MDRTDFKIAIIEKAFQWIDGALLLFLSLALLDKITIPGKIFCSLDTTRVFLSDCIHTQGLSMSQWIMLPLSLWLWNVILKSMGMYQYSIIMDDDLKSFALRMLVSITAGLGCLFLLLSILDFLLNNRFLLLQNILISLGAWIGIFVIYRIVGTAILRFNRNFRQQDDLPHALIVGVNERSLAFAKKMNTPIKKYFLIGYADDNIRRDILRKQCDAPLLFRSLDNIEDHISKYRVDVLFIMLPLSPSS